MSLPPAPLSLSRFRGCVIGALAGDCLGAPLEHNAYYGSFKTEMAAEQFKKKAIGFVKEKSEAASSPATRSAVESQLLRYTDDSAMHLSILQSLVKGKGRIKSISALAQRFSESYFEQADRGYGGSVVTLFYGIRTRGSGIDAREYAAQSFNGNGSFGNGAAMRVSAIGLAFARDTKWTDMYETVVHQSEITHTNPLAVLGAILQASAVRKTVNIQGEINPDEWLDSLMKTDELGLRAVYNPKVNNEEMQHNADELACPCADCVYKRKMNSIKKLVKDQSFDQQLIIKELGNTIGAADSVPTALFVFLRAFTPIPGIEIENRFLRTMAFSLSLGGDTDTIATMAGALAGAYYGIEHIPDELTLRLEAHHLFDTLANDLYKKFEMSFDCLPTQILIQSINQIADVSFRYRLSHVNNKWRHIILKNQSSWQTTKFICFYAGKTISLDKIQIFVPNEVKPREKDCHIMDKKLLSVNTDFVWWKILPLLSRHTRSVNIICDNENPWTICPLLQDENGYFKNIIELKFTSDGHFDMDQAILLPQIFASFIERQKASLKVCHFSNGSIRKCKPRSIIEALLKCDQMRSIHMNQNFLSFTKPERIISETEIDKKLLIDLIKKNRLSVIDLDIDFPADSKQQAELFLMNLPEENSRKMISLNVNVSIIR